MGLAADGGVDILAADIAKLLCFGGREGVVVHGRRCRAVDFECWHWVWRQGVGLAMKLVGSVVSKVGGGSCLLVGRYAALWLEEVIKFVLLVAVVGWPSEIWAVVGPRGSTFGHQDKSPDDTDKCDDEPDKQHTCRDNGFLTYSLVQGIGNM